MNSYIATFYTHYGAMKFYKHYKKCAITVKLMPTPRTLGASCGICAFFECEDLSDVIIHEQYDIYDLEACYLAKDGEYCECYGYSEIE